jgi:hypothetical protein
MFAFLRALGLKPIEWSQAIALTGKGSPYIGDVLDAAFEEGQAIVVLLTPDDIAYVRREFASSDEDPDLKPQGQARPNVLFEAGMAMGRNPNQTILVELGELRRFTDVDGRHTIRMENSSQMRKSLAERLLTAGCRADMSGNDWMTAGDFTPPPKPGNGLPVGLRVPARARTGACVDGQWYSSGGNKFDEIKVTNIGPVPIYEIRLAVPEALKNHVKLFEDEPVSKLPAGKSFTVRGITSNRYHGGSGPNQFELLAEGRLEDGSAFKQEVYFDAG